jgi:hypothetical protein
VLLNDLFHSFHVNSFSPEYALSSNLKDGFGLIFGQLVSEERVFEIAN